MHSGNETFEINLYWEDINNNFSKWPFNFADISKNYVHCENALIFHIVLFSFDYIALNDNKTTNNCPKPSDL